MKYIPILFFLMAPLSAIGQPAKSIASRLKIYMQAQHDTNRFGGTALVTRHDTVLLKRAYGLADYEWDIKNTIDTKFELASVTKQFTAVAILQLIESGKLSLDDKLSRFFPDYPKADSVSIHMLLSHSSGLGLGYLELSLTTITKDSAYARIKKIPYEFPPGTRSTYSNIGYYLLAMIIEKISGKSYSAYLKENVFDKAGMKYSGVNNPDSIVLKRAKLYCREGNGFINNPYFNWNITLGPAGIYSTAGDLYLWSKALMQGTAVLSEVSKKKMFTSYGDEHFGYGILVNPFYNQGHFMLAHDGSALGAMTSFNFYPEDGVFITVLSNNQSSAYLIAYGLAAIVFGKPVSLPYKHNRVKADTSSYHRYAGTYGAVKIINKHGQLFYNSEEIELIPESPTIFFRSDNNERTVEFITQGNGKVSSIIVSKAGVAETIIRTD